jgi:ribA/ribD-fused uncharacterized protein
MSMGDAWTRAGNAVFRKTRDPWGGFSNMCAGYPITIDGITVRTSEALYQALKFPTHPDIQELVISQRSPMAAKMVTKPHRDKIRCDWVDTREDIMYWCLVQKLHQNPSFVTFLEASAGMDIVEDSFKDRYWGAVPNKAGDVLYGANRLGNLLMRLRREWFGIGTVRALLPADSFLCGNPLSNLVISNAIA